MGFKQDFGGGGVYTMQQQYIGQDQKRKSFPPLSISKGKVPFRSHTPNKLICAPQPEEYKKSVFLNETTQKC